MVSITQFLALLCACLFSGAALYEGLVESRTTLALTQDDPVAHFARGFRSSGTFQAPLVLVGTAAGLIAAVLSRKDLWIAGAALMLLVVVVTGLLVFPLNARLLRPETHPVTDDRRPLVIQWYRLHTVRGLIALTASILFLVVLVQAH